MQKPWLFNSACSPTFFGGFAKLVSGRVVVCRFLSGNITGAVKVVHVGFQRNVNKFSLRHQPNAMQHLDKKHSIVNTPSCTPLLPKVGTAFILHGTLFPNKLFDYHQPKAGVKAGVSCQQYPLMAIRQSGLTWRTP
jgi:hypothetical protein